jgi:hypothetical protein
MDLPPAPGRKPGRNNSEMARGRKKSAGEVIQLQPGQLSGREPGHVAEFIVAWARGTSDDRGFVHRGDVGGAISIRVTDLVLRAAEDVQQPYQPDLDADLFAGLPGGGLGRRFTDLDRAAENPPPIVMACVPDEQQSPGLVDGDNRDGREQEQVVPDSRPQPCDVR